MRINETGDNTPSSPQGETMSKTKTAEFADNIEMPSFDVSKATDQFRVFAEKAGVDPAEIGAVPNNVAPS